MVTDRYETHLMALLSFSYVIFSLFFRLPQSWAIVSDWINLNTPSLWFSHFNTCGLYVGLFNRSKINSHRCWLFTEKQNQIVNKKKALTVSGISVASFVCTCIYLAKQSNILWNLHLYSNGKLLNTFSTLLSVQYFGYTARSLAEILN